MWSIAVLATTGACGGDLLGGDVPIVHPTVDASSPGDGGSPETSVPDAAVVQDVASIESGGPVCGGGETWSTVLVPLLDASGPSWQFDRMKDFLDFIRTIAVQYDFVDPATGMLCTQVATCTYDPRQLRISPQDVHHSNALNEFIGPDGRPYVWAWFPPLNEWLLVGGLVNPQGYRLLVEFNAGCSPGCACDAG
jgi:hypothetical protein